MLVEQLRVSTPQAWLDYAAAHVPALLNDHANCEQKAAATAINLMFKFSDRPDLAESLSRIAREELVHFEQVRKLMRQKNIEPQLVPTGRYASGLRAAIRTPELLHQLDTLLVCAVIEARSCERFQALMPVLDETLAKFYGRLYASEARHADTYLRFIEQVQPGADYEARLETFLNLDAKLMTEPDEVFAFHGGPLLA